MFYLDQVMLMASGFSRLKPGVKRRTHLFLSAFLWTVIGCMLIGKGWLRLQQLEEYQVFLVGGALVAGSLKSCIALDRAARRATERILSFKDDTCLGAVYSLKTWALVLCMVGMGIVLRHSSLPPMLLCAIYFTIGWSLLFSSRLAWIAWYTRKKV